MPLIGGCTAMPVIDDLTVVKLVLALPIGEAFREELQELADGLEPGKFGQLKRRDRDKFVKLALHHGAIQRPKTIERNAVVYAPGHYSDRETPGTAFAVAIIASQVPSKGGAMPVPPGRKAP